MNQIFKPFAILLVLVACFLWAVASVASDDYLARPVRVIVAFTPGGTTDMLTRMVCSRLSER